MSIQTSDELNRLADLYSFWIDNDVTIDKEDIVNVRNILTTLVNVSADEPERGDQWVSDEKSGDSDLMVSLDYADHWRNKAMQLAVENENLRTVMIAAAEEIQKYWHAHCDAEGYGPANLIRRLEMGIPSEYGYKSGDFERLRKENEQLRQQLSCTIDILEQTRKENDKDTLYDMTEIFRG